MFEQLTTTIIAKMKFAGVLFATFALPGLSHAALITLDDVEINASGINFVLGANVSGSTGTGFSTTNFVAVGGSNDGVAFDSTQNDTASDTLVGITSVTVTAAVGGQDLTFDFRITGATDSATQKLRFQDFGGLQWVAVGGEIKAADNESLQFSIENAKVNGIGVPVSKIEFSNPTWRPGAVGVLSTSGLVTDGNLDDARITGFDLSFAIVPEPTSSMLALLGFVGLVGTRRRRRT